MKKKTALKQHEKTIKTPLAQIQNGEYFNQFYIILEVILHIDVFSNEQEGKPINR